VVVKLGRKVALGGIFTGLSLIFLYFALYLPSMKLTMYFLAGMIPGLILVELGIRQAWMLYGATSLLSFVMFGNTVSIIPYVVFFGLYPMLKFYIEKTRRPVIEILMKLLFFNMSIGFVYIIWAKFFSINVHVDFPIMWIIIVMQPAFLLYDYIFTGVIFYYYDKIRLKWRKD